MLRSKRARVLLLSGLVALLATAGGAQMQTLDGGTVVGAVERLKPGHFIWVPQLAPEGPVLVVVNIASQRLVAYRNGVPIAVSTVSTGRAGHRTPTGVFTILQKNIRHRSSTYNNAPMPYMQRLTWAGVALHGGNLPGYPASHGCIRLPHEFAKLLFDQTELGMTVVIVNQPAQLRIAPTVAAVQAGRRGLAAGPATWRPELSPWGPVSIVVSAADRRMVVLRNGVEIGSAPVSFDGVVDRIQAYVLNSIEGGQYNWTRMLLPGQGAPAPAAQIDDGARFQGTDPFRQALASVVRPGTTMVVIPDTLGLGGGSAPAPQMAQEMTVIENGPVVADWMSDGGVAGGR